jgi:hypothetical protein
MAQHHTFPRHRPGILKEKHVNTQQTANEVLRNAAYSARLTMKANSMAALVKANPHLIPVEKCKNPRLAATKNIRIELKRAFPEVKFSITSSTFSMGDAIDVSWTDGPTVSQVDQIIGKYKAGSFDSMNDIYEYSNNAWTNAFGDAKYVHSRREYSDKMLTSVIGRVCRRYGGLDAIPTAEDYRKGRLWNLHNSDGTDIHEAIGRALQKHTYSITR